jgi:hypothetical protein
MVEVNDPDGNKVVFVQDTSKGIWYRYGIVG